MFHKYTKNKDRLKSKRCPTIKIFIFRNSLHMRQDCSTICLLPRSLWKIKIKRKTFSKPWEFVWRTPLTFHIWFSMSVWLSSKRTILMLQKIENKIRISYNWWNTSSYITKISWKPFCHPRTMLKSGLARDQNLISHTVLDCFEVNIKICLYLWF